MRDELRELINKIEIDLLMIKKLLDSNLSEKSKFLIKLNVIKNSFEVQKRKFQQINEC
jgi:hypothetical protein